MRADGQAEANTVARHRSESLPDIAPARTRMIARCGGVFALAALGVSLAGCANQQRQAMTTPGATTPGATPAVASGEPIAVGTASPMAFAPESGQTATTSGVLDPQLGVVASPIVATGERISPSISRKGRYMVGKPYMVAGRTYVPREDPSYVAVGSASWYGTGFHGRKTANGEVFNMNDITAAHPTMPLPSYARVTNLKNGSSIVVRVNDRGPFHGGRLLDVSKRTAEILDFKGAGVGRVKVEYLGPAQPFGADNETLMATLRTDGTPAPRPGSAGHAVVAQAGTTRSKTIRGLPVIAPAPPVEAAAYAPSSAPAADGAPAAAAETPFSSSGKAGAPRVLDEPADAKPADANRQRTSSLMLVPLEAPRLGVADIVGSRSGAALAYADTEAGGPISVDAARFYVEAGRFTSRAVAAKVLAALASDVAVNAEMAAVRQGDRLVWAVRAGPYADETRAGKARLAARKAGATSAEVTRP